MESPSRAARTGEATDEVTVELVQRALRRLADPVKAGPMQAYMKSSMPYLGVQTPRRRKACQRVYRQRPLAVYEAWRDTVGALWWTAQYREERYAALDLAGFRPYREFQQFRALGFYGELIVSGAWWDLVDRLAPRLGEILERSPVGTARRMRSWAHSGNLWKRRAAIICQLRRKDATDEALLVDCIEPSIDSEEFFLRKGIGWALREYGKTRPEFVRGFVRRYRGRLSPLTVREALRRIES